MRSLFLLSLICITLPHLSQSQVVFPEAGLVFNDAIVSRIDIKIDKDSLATLLLKENLYSDHEYPADFYWTDGTNKDSVLQVGFRLRGNTSRSSAKKSFKVKFNHFKSKKFYGLSDLNLNGEHNDPSLVRAKLSWKMMTLAGLEAPRANHVALYINGEYKGLYLNVEHIDNDYFEARNQDPDGQLFKCFYGCDFRYAGNDPSSYSLAVYTPQNHEENPDIASLIAFFKALNAPVDGSYRCNLEKVFDVDTYLRRMAMEVLLGHWDNPLFNKNNAYIYIHPDTKKVEVLSYDIDNTFGIDWFNVNWADRNVYSWAPSNQARPIYTQLLAVPEYKKRYGHYLSQFCNAFFNAAQMTPYLQQLKENISPYRIGDVYASYDYGYSFDDFIRSFDVALGAHAKYGLTEYIARRSASALSQLQNTQIAPIIEEASFSNDGTSMTIRCRITGLSAMQANLDYRPVGNPWLQTPLYDNGTFPDDQAGDGWYACQLPISGKQTMELLINTRDASFRSSTWPVCGTWRVSVGFDEVPMLRLNEWMADNTSIPDPLGEYDDWIEIYNAGSAAIPLNGRYLTDNASLPGKWELPPVSVAPNGFLLIWADEDQHQGATHANFKLSKSGEFLGLFDTKENGYATIDSVHFGPMPTNTTLGRLPDGQGGILRLPTVSPGRSNGTPSGSGTMHPILFQLSSPCLADCILRGIQPGDIVQIFNHGGMLIWQEAMAETNEISLDVSSWASGSYWVLLRRGNNMISRQLIRP